MFKTDWNDSGTMTPYYYHTNGIGSVTAITDSSGNLIERVDYDIYGMPTFWDYKTDPNNPSIVSNSLIGNSILYHGRRYDKETNLYYYRARYYDPIMGRFLQTDPMGYEDSMNMYSAFNQNPVNFTDPMGEQKVRIIFPDGKYVDSDGWGNYNKETELYFDPVTGKPGRRKRKKQYAGPFLMTDKELVMEVDVKTGHMLAEGSNTLIDFIPIAGDIKGIGEGLKGKDILGNKLSWLERGLCFLCMSELKNVVKGGKKTIKLTNRVKKLAESNITDLSTTVLGSYKAKLGKLNYIQKAKKLGASYFDVGKAWDDLVKIGVEWEADKHFLDVIAKKGDDILLSIPKTKIKPGSYLAREISYLVKEKGYKWINQWKLVKK